MNISTFLLKKKLRYTSNLTLVLVLLMASLINLLPMVDVQAAEVDGDKYVTKTELTKMDGQPIINGGTMEIAQTYYLTYDWEIPDNTFRQNDTLTFSIPKEFKIVNQFVFPLVDPAGEEVAIANIRGNDTEGYRIEMTFTTDYVQTHSDVSGSLRMEYTLNQTYVKGDETITIPLPDGNIDIEVPHYNQPGGGGGIGAGESNNLAKHGEIKNGIKYNPETGKYDLPQRYVEWGINLGLGKLTDAIGKDNFDNVDRVVIEDAPQDQQIVSMSLYQEHWSDEDWGWQKAFFKDTPFDYGTIKENEVDLKKDSTNSYVQSFSYDIWPYIQEELDKAVDENTVLDEVAIDYYAEPLEFLTETTNLKNDATVKIYFKDGSEGESWHLSDSVEWNVADGEINGRVSAVEFKKIDDDTQAPLPGAKFDLYKKGIDGKYVLKKTDLVSDKDGLVRIDKLTTGDYYFEETQSPEGYPVPENPRVLDFTVETEDLGGSQNVKYLGEVKNFPENGKVDVMVEKKWDDGNNQDGVRPASIKAQLYANGQASGDPVTLNQSNNWQYSWKDLDEKANGQTIKYEVKETSNVPGYETTITGNGSDSVTIVNKHITETRDINGKKTWKDNNNNQGNRPQEIVVELYGNNKLVDSQKTNAQKNWSYAFTNLPTNENGKPINYTVKEKPVQDYEADYNGFDITNTYKPELTKVSVKKVWNDKNDQDGIRPQNIQVQLKGNGQPVGSVVTLDEKKDWNYTWNDLEKRENGKAINYTVEEVSDPGKYKVETTKENDYQITLTNNYTPEQIDVQGTKKWNDNQNQQGNRPAKITVELYGNGKLIDTQDTTAAKNWSYSFTNLPKNSQGKPIKYEVKEQYVEDYEAAYSGYDITNTYNPELTEVSVKKAWNDKDNQDGIRPQSIQVQLKGNGKAIGDPVTLNEKNTWNYTWKDLEKRENGKMIDYTVEEVGDLGKYKVDTVKENDYQVLLTNNYKPEEIAVNGTKKWDDNQDEKGNRPTKIVVELYGDGKLVSTQETNAANNWSYSFTNLPKNNQGKPIKYEVKEQAVEDYDASYSGFDITNTYHPELVKMSVKKDWDDKENQDGIRPTSIQVQLKGNGKAIGEPVTLDEKNNWSFTWENLEKRENGEKVDYTVEEVSDPGKYTLETTKDNDYSVMLTNHYTPEETEIRGNKTWQDNNDQDGMRPSEIKIHLIANGRPEPVATQTVKPDAEGSWSYAFTGLPKKEKGKDIDYTIKEEAVPDYEFSSEKAADPTIINLTNTHELRKTYVDVEKHWDDKEDQDGIRPESVYIQLLADGEKVGEPVELNESNQWKYSWKELDERKAGQLIDYTVEEVKLDADYQSSIEQKDKEHFAITNAHTPEETQVEGTKTWDDNNNEEGQRPAKIVVRLYGDGAEVAKKTVTAEDDWSYTFTNLPKNNKGKEIVYTVSEDPIVDYTPSINGTNIVNKYTPGVTDIGVTKKWEDGNNQDGIRPEKIYVQLHADGKAVGEPVALNEENNWSHKWEDLVARAYGKDIDYSVKEVDTPKGYQADIDDSNKEEIVITNSHEPEKVKISGTKHWKDEKNRFNERPDTITVNLLADGKEVASKEVTEADNWRYEFSDLPKFENGKEIIYTVTEKEVPNYTTAIDGFDITNTYIPKEDVPPIPGENPPKGTDSPKETPSLPKTSGSKSEGVAQEKGTSGRLPKTGSQSSKYLVWLGALLIIIVLIPYIWFKKNK